MNENLHVFTYVAHTHRHVQKRDFTQYRSGIDSGNVIIGTDRFALYLLFR